MTDIIEKDKGRRVELIYTSDQHTKLKPGDKGTYQFLITNPPPIGYQHCIEWDSGSNLGMVAGDQWKFIEE